MAVLTRRILVVLAALLALPLQGFAQSVNVRATDPATGALVQVGDATNNGLRVNLVGTNSVNQAGTWNMRIQDASGNGLTSLLTGSQRSITVAVVDSSGNQVSSFGGAGGTASNFTSNFPASGTAIGYSDGTNMQAGRVFDLDTGGGTQYSQGVNLRISSSGGSIEAKGAQTSANSLPVVLATDEAAIPVTQSGAWSTRSQDGSGNNLTSLSVGAQRAITVAIVDGSGAQITSFGGAGGTSSNFGSAFPTPGTAIGYTDGANMQGARVVDADTSGGTFYSLAVNLIKRTSGTPTELIGAATSANSIPVVVASDQAAFPVTLASITSAVTPGTAAANLGKAEDAAHTTGDTGVMLLGVRQSSATDLSAGATNGDYEPLQVDANGRVWTNPFPAAPAAATYLPVRLSDGSQFLTPSTDATHDTALTTTWPGGLTTVTGPIGMVRASAAVPSDVSADNDAVMLWALRSGALATQLTAGGALIGGDASLGLKVQCMSGCAGSGGTSSADGATYTAGSTAGTPLMAARDDTSPGTVAEDKIGLVRMDTNRQLYTVLRDAAGNNRGANVNASNQLSVSIDAAVGLNVSQIAGGSASTVATGVLKVAIADSGGTAYVSAANGLNSTGGGLQTAQIIGQFDDTSPTAITENQFGNLRISANRNLYSTLRDAAGNERGANVNASNQLSVSVDNSNVSANLAQVGGNAILTGNGTTGTGSPRVTLASDTSSNTNPLYASAVGTSSTAAASGCYLVSAASTNSTSCKGSAGNLYGIRMVNTTTTTYYLRLYNSASAPTCSSSTGFIESIPIPPASAAGQAGGIAQISDVAINYGTGIGFCFTGGSSSTDNTNAATGVFGAVLYK